MNIEKQILKWIVGTISAFIILIIIFLVFYVISSLQNSDIAKNPEVNKTLENTKQGFLSFLPWYWLSGDIEDYLFLISIMVALLGGGFWLYEKYEERDYGA